MWLISRGVMTTALPPGSSYSTMATMAARFFVTFLSLTLIRCSLCASDDTLSANAADYVCQTFPDYGAYINQFRANHPQESIKLYPYGETYCDTIAGANQKIFGFDPRIQFSIPYYGKLYTNLWVSPSGFISLSSGGQTEPVPWRWLDEWPNPQYPVEGAQDPPFIAPFYSQSDLNRNPPEPSMITYRILDPREASPGGERLVTDGMLNEVSHALRAAVLGADTFQGVYGLVVTWYKVTFAANDCNPATDNCARNTFQAVIITDEVDTYTVFSYYNMTWVGGGGDQACDRITGRTSTEFPNCKPGHIGFNAGFGREFHALPYSGLDRIRSIDIEGGSNHTGRFYYRVSGDTIFRGGCANDTSFAGERWPTEIYPQSGGMFGGTEVNVSGPCFPNPDRIKCRYGNQVTEAVYIANNIMRVTCLAPIMYKVGPVKIAVSIDGGTNFKFETEYIVVTPGHVVPGVSVSRQTDDWLSPGAMQLLWSPLSLTPNLNDRVNIKLFGYREDSSSGNPVGIWQALHTFAEEYSNTGVYDLNPDSHKCDYNAEGQLCTKYNVGAFQVSVEYPGNDPTNPRREWSQVFPLGWYIDDAMVKAEGSDWIPHKCSVWYHENDRDTAWLSDLDACTCTLDQALMDFGRYQPDPHCRQDSTAESNCETHVGAIQCLLSTYASSSTGAGNECCYDGTRHLLYSGDDMYGSRPQRSHAWGAPPYMVPPRVPELSHWVRDLQGFYYCCQWHSSKADCYQQFSSLRPTKSCHNYTPSGQAAAFGDPHFRTFDDVFYTFNGYGEYWLMQVLGAQVHGETLDFKLHARFQQPANQSWGQTKGTYVTAVGMQLDDSHRVVVTLNSGGMHKKLLVYLNHYLLDLTEVDLRRQEFTDGIIINNDDSGNGEATNFTIIYRCGVGVNVMWRNELLDVLVSAPPEFKGKTRGLLGKWNDNPDDDLEPPGGGGVPFRPDETEKVHYQFGEKWRVTSSDSCFRDIYRAQLNHKYYNRDYFVPNFTPTFPPNNTKYTDEDVQRVCAGDLACTFDFKTTINENIGRDTRSIHEWAQHRRVMGSAVLSCGWLNVQYSIKSEPISYLAGSQVTITGCVDGYSLEGPTSYTCVDQGDGTASWSPEVSTICRGPDDPLPTTTVLAIAIPVALVGVLLIIGIVVLILVCRRKKKKQRQLAESKQIMADFMGGGADAVSLNTTGQKPPRPEPRRPSLGRSLEGSLDTAGKPEYDNKGSHDSSTPTVSSGATGKNVSWDTTDAPGTSKPLKQSTLKSDKTKKKKKNKKEKKNKTGNDEEPPIVIPPDASPVPSPTTKRKRPYQYPTESRDNSREDWTPNESPTLKIRSAAPSVDQGSTYRPRDVHAYTTGHNIPTQDVQSSNYYKRKYGRYNNTSFA